jgi:hypothetical protein
MLNVTELDAESRVLKEYLTSIEERLPSEAERAWIAFQSHLLIYAQPTQPAADHGYPWAGKTVLWFRTGGI